MEALGEPSWPFGLPCWPGARPESSANACAVSNGVRLDFSLLFCALVERPNLNFRQPVCSVLYTSDEVRTERAQAAKQHENQGFSASKFKPGSLEIEPGRPPASAKPRRNRRSLLEFLKLKPNEQDKAKKVTREVRSEAPVTRRTPEASGASCGLIRKDV